MTIHYVSSDVSLNDLTSISNGDTVLFKTNTTFDASKIAPGLIYKNNITIGMYGTGSKPVISGAVNRSGNTFAQTGVDAATLVAQGIWILALGHTRCGNVLENDVHMNLISWRTDFTTTYPFMTAGSFTCNTTTGELYIKPFSGPPSGKTYTVSEVLYAFNNSNLGLTGLSISDLEFRSISNCAIILSGISNTRIDNLDGFSIGGDWQASGSGFYVGNFIQFGGNSYLGTVSNCTAADVYDTSYTTQTFESDKTITDISFINNTASRCGMSGVEISMASSVAASNQLIKNIVVDGFTATDIGKNMWALDRAISGETVCLRISGAANIKNKVHNCEVRNINVTNAEKLFLTYNTNGTNRFIDSYGYNVTYLALNLGSQPDDIHQYYNVTGYRTSDLATLVTPVAVSRWQLTTGLAQPIRTTLKR